MEICRFLGPDDRVRYGIVEGEQVEELRGGPIEAERSGRRHPLAGLRLKAPVEPGKIVCLGRNYRAHAAEMSSEPPPRPLLFLKPPSAILDPLAPIELPPDSARVDYEGELAVVIGRRCSRLRDDQEVRPLILGFTCLNDVTARDLQQGDGQWTRAKGFDTFCPVGPVLQTELDWERAGLSTHVNGTLRQEASLSEMIFPVDFTIRYISRIMTLEPGDVIATGTPAGIGPLAPGDLVEVGIEGIGTLRNPVRAREQEMSDIP